MTFIDHMSILKKNYYRLLQLLDLETGALDDLLSLEIITETQYNNWSELTSHKQNEEFLGFVIMRCPRENFLTILKVLNDCHQEHVVNFILSAGSKFISFCYYIQLLFQCIISYLLRHLII